MVALVFVNEIKKGEDRTLEILGGESKELHVILKDDDSKQDSIPHWVDMLNKATKEAKNIDQTIQYELEHCTVPEEQGQAGDEPSLSEFGRLYHNKKLESIQILANSIN